MTSGADDGEEGEEAPGAEEHANMLEEDVDGISDAKAIWGEEVRSTFSLRPDLSRSVDYLSDSCYFSSVCPNFSICQTHFIRHPNSFAYVLAPGFCIFIPPSGIITSPSPFHPLLRYSKTKNSLWHKILPVSHQSCAAPA